MIEVDLSPNEVVGQLLNDFAKSHHFRIVHYCKKREQIEERYCYWDSKSKVWFSTKGKLIITCVATSEDKDGDPIIDGYRNFSDIFSIKGYVSKNNPKSERLQ